jgi:hypothetical protein
MEKSGRGEKKPNGRRTISEQIRDFRLEEIPSNIDPEVIKRELNNVKPHEEYVTEGGLLRALQKVIKKS